MNLKKTRYSLAHKISAIGFIFIILAGNFWLLQTILKLEVTPLIAYIFFCGVILAIIGGFGILFQTIRALFKYEK